MVKDQRTFNFSSSKNHHNRIIGFFSDDDFGIEEFKDEFYISLKTNQRSECTISFYQQKLTNFFDWCRDKRIKRFCELKPHVIREFLSVYREGHTIGGTHAYYRAIRSYLNWVWDEYDIEMPNPINKVKCANQQPDPIPGVKTDDVDKLFKSAKQGKQPVRDCAILAVLFDTGIRLSSLFAIQKQDVDVITGCLYIRHQKNKKPTSVYLGNKSRKFIRKLMRSLPHELPPDSTIWFNQDGSPMEIHNIYNILKRITQRAGTETYSPHDFRRFFALQSYRNGADVFAVSALLNHSGIEVTKRYLAIDENDKRKIHNKISPLDKQNK